MKLHPSSHPRHLIVCLGDQLDSRSAAFDGFDPRLDAVWMAEVDEESTHVWSHKARTALFLSAMRHFRDGLRARGSTVHYRELDNPANTHRLASELTRIVHKLKPRRLIMTEAGDWDVEQSLRTAAGKAGLDLEIRPDRHFLCSRDEFAVHAQARKQLRMEFFYRDLRRKTGVLMDAAQPAGGQWNFDSENRQTFGQAGPGTVPAPVSFAPDQVTCEVFALVEKRFPKHPGSLAHFDWPVTRAQARKALADFIKHRLPLFGKFQDAMRDSGNAAAPYLYHSRLSAALNLHLLHPREVIDAAEQAYREGRAPLAGAEGFIRQILGWREYVRGIYWHFMPRYMESNQWDARQTLPKFYWTGQTDMNCLRHAIGQTLAFGYAHHIQRLMVTGLYALLLGVEPKQVHEWYLAVYVDAIEWVELPNTLGLSQFADGGLMASKPYVATGKYIQRMSNYCQGCRFKPGEAAGEQACPFTTLYWDFLLRHAARLGKNPRMTMQLKNLSRLKPSDRKSIRAQAKQLRTNHA